MLVKVLRLSSVMKANDMCGVAWYVDGKPREVLHKVRIGVSWSKSVRDLLKIYQTLVTKPTGPKCRKWRATKISHMDILPMSHDSASNKLLDLNPKYKCLRWDISCHTNRVLLRTNDKITWSAWVKNTRQFHASKVCLGEEWCWFRRHQEIRLRAQTTIQFLSVLRLVMKSGVGLNCWGANNVFPWIHVVGFQLGFSGLLTYTSFPATM